MRSDAKKLVRDPWFCRTFAAERHAGSQFPTCAHVLLERFSVPVERTGHNTRELRCGRSPISDVGCEKAGPRNRMPTPLPRSMAWGDRLPMLIRNGGGVILMWGRTSFLSALLLALTLSAVFSTCAHSGTARIQIPLSDGGFLPAFVFTPDTSSRCCPGVVVAGNAGGVNLVQYHTYCQKLAERNYVALLIDGSNFPESLAPGPDTWRRMPYHIWAWACHLLVAARLGFGHDWYVCHVDAAVECLRSLPEVDSTRIALSGFSQSANACLCYASANNGKVKSLVWNNGGSPWIMPYDPSRVPPALILHGEKDGVYSVDYARNLASELKRAGSDVECFVYPGQRHMFMVYYDLTMPSDEENPALASSFERLCAFLSRTLGGHSARDSMQRDTGQAKDGPQQANDR
jgi:dienelactone hydrolase